MAGERQAKIKARTAKAKQSGKQTVSKGNSFSVTPTTTQQQPKQIVQNPMVEQQPPTVQQYDPREDIQALSEARKKSQIEGLRSRMEQSKADIADKRAAIPEQYNEQRRQASVQSRMGSKNFSEFLASRGLARSGEAGQARLMQNQALQGQLGAIGRQQQSALDTLGRDEQRLQQQYLSDMGAIESGIASDTMQQMINARMQQDAIARQQAIRAEDIARQDMLRQQGFAREDLLRQQDLGIRAEDIARQEAIRQQQMLREDERYQFEQDFKLQEANRDYDIELSRLGIDSRGMDLREKEAIFNEIYKGEQMLLDRDRLSEQERQARAREALQSRGYDLESRGLDIRETEAAKKKEKDTSYNYSQAASDINDIAYDKLDEELDREAAINRINQLYNEGRITAQIVKDLVTRLKLEGE